MKKSVLYGIFLLCGIALMALSLVLEGRISDSVGGTMMGVGAGALGYCGSNLMVLRRAQAVSGEVLQWAVMGAAFVSIGLDAPLWVTLAAVGVFLAKCVLELWLMVRYQREM